jgi:beta-1,4-mannooligosaccharide/beta-1,4-mannosyl-N-acetylglucosamine phosphorylase
MPTHEGTSSRAGTHGDANPVGLFTRFEGNPIVTAADLPYRVNTVFNPAAAPLDGDTVLLMRVEDLRGISHLAAARSRNGRTDWRFDPMPTFESDPDNHPEEIWGVEDPRVTWLPENGEWAVAYTAYSRRGPLVSLAFTRDFRNFNRLGPAMPPEDKDAALFPRRFGGRWALIHRPSQLLGPSNMWLSYSPDLVHWGDHSLLLPAREGSWWDAGKIGLGPPPLETPDGWLVLYHGVHATASGSLYRLGLALLDLEDPRIVLRRSDEWVFGPSEPYERVGDVVGVTFPCGWIFDAATDELRLYYGAADSTVALAVARLSHVLDYVRSCPKPDRRRMFDRR